ncbi:MAG: hypothetical protein WC876_10645 [Candidatus Thermoplasmatota archaeon]|jgi:hypothetical protein
MASSVIAFLIAGVLFTASVVAVLVTTRNSSDAEATGDATESARFNIQSAGLADVLLGSPGFNTVSNLPSQLDWANAANYNGRTRDADNLTRLGLLDSEEPSMMNYSKFQNLRRAGYFANSTNGYVDYEEAAESLGLADANLDFHIRAKPNLDTLAELLSEPSKDTNLRVTYVGDIEVTTTSESLTGDPVSMTNPVCSLDASNPQVYVISVTVHNAGSATTQFTAVTAVDIGGNSQVQNQNTNGFLVLAGDSVTLSVEVPAIEGRSCAGGSAVFDLYDPVNGKLDTSTAYKPETDGGPDEDLCDGDVDHPCLNDPGAPAEADIGLHLDTDKQNYRNTADPVILNYDGNGLKNNDDLFLRVCSGTVECTSAAATYTSPGANTFNAASNTASRIVNIGTLTTAGEYTAWLYDCEEAACGSPAAPDSDNLRVTERILVTTAPVGGYVPADSVVLSDPIYTAPAGPAQEVLYLETLMSKFCPTWFNSNNGADSPLTGVDWDDRCNSEAVDFFKTDPAGQTQPGDVFPDTKQVMNDDLPTRLICQSATCPGAGFGGQDIVEGEPRYDITNVLVIGSGVDHSAMTSNAAKGTIRDWVHGGGTIVVFGSDEGNVNWLEPLFHSAIRGGGGAISTPDQGHPMLHTPNELDNPAANYDARNSTWRFNGQTAQAQDDPDTAVFSNVIVVDGTQTTGDPLLSLSNKGSFGAGSIIITAYMPYDLYNDASVSGQAPGDDCPGVATLGECEGMRFMHNLLMQGYGDLFLEYGPELPSDANVQPDSRTVQIRHPQFADPIVLEIIVYVF